MNYIESYHKLREVFSSVESEKSYEHFSVHKIRFQSSFSDLLPGKTQYRCEEHDIDFEVNSNYYNNVGTIQDDVQQEDYLVEENRTFNYYLLKHRKAEKIEKVTFIFHGFNEKKLG